ncbi:MAG: hypothetical protein CMK44_01020 [Porticoccus sp.]|nr:hypothetical protein [Porticoccus sp.]
MEQKKKRGRKPKNKIIVNENPKFEQEKIDNLISSICIKKDKISSSEVCPNDSSNNINMEVSEYESSDSICWNCSQNIYINVCYPINYINGIFHLNGRFCSYECAGRHIFDNYHGKELFDKYTLLNLYYNKNHNTCKKVKIAPEKINLKIFGGTMDYEQYINKSSLYNIQNSYIPPSIYVNHNVSKGINKEDNIFKMYRKKDIKTNNLFKDIENEENSNENLISNVEEDN